jgi:hypothetical protein
MPAGSIFFADRLRQHSSIYIQSDFYSKPLKFGPRIASKVPVTTWKPASSIEPRACRSRKSVP